MPDCLCCLVKMIVGSLPIEDPHAQQWQQRGIVYLRPINNPEPFSPSDHMGPQPIIKVQVWEDVVPPTMVCSCLVLPHLVNPMEGVLGNLQLLSVFLSRRNKERGYLERCWIMSPSRWWGILFVAESSNFAQKPTCGYWNRRPRSLPKGRSLDDWVLK